MQITWFGHSCFRIDSAKSSVLIEPLVIPCHYGTFPIIDQTADKFAAEMGGNTVLVPKVGVPFDV